MTSQQNKMLCLFHESHELFDMQVRYKARCESQLHVYVTRLTNIRLDLAGESLSNMVK